MSRSNVTYIDEVDIKNKTVLLRVDFNVSLAPGLTIADDLRIQQSLPTINHLLNNNNRLILISHFDRPKKRDPKYSLKVVTDHLQQLLPEYKISLVDDFLSNEGLKQIKEQKDKEIIVLENIRFYPEEKNNDPDFAKKLAKLADIYINDAFGVSHRNNASIVSAPLYLNSFGGLLLKREVNTISRVIENAQKPVVAIIGGAKISTKINLIGKLMVLADFLLLGGGLANTFFCAQGLEIGDSFCEYDQVENARRLLFLAAQKQTALILPSDVIVGNPKDYESSGDVKKIEIIPKGTSILDIGPETQAQFGAIIAQAKTIIWNGPLGYIENPAFRRGTDFIYYAIAKNHNAFSLVGGGDTLVAISKKEYLDQITHVSTGGGAMLEFIEKGTLAGIEALKTHPQIVIPNVLPTQ